MAAEKINQFINYGIMKDYNIETIVEFLISHSNINETDERSSFIEAVSKIKREDLEQIVALLSAKVFKERMARIKDGISDLNEKKQVLVAMREALEKNIMGSLVDFDNQVDYYNYLYNVGKIDKAKLEVELARINYDKAKLNHKFIEVYYSTLIDTLNYKLDKRKSIKTENKIYETKFMKDEAMLDAMQNLNKAYFDYMTVKMKNGLIDVEAWEEIYENYSISRDEYDTKKNYINSVKKK